MIQEASITGLFRTIIIIVGALVLLRFIGQLMNAKRNAEEANADANRRRKLAEEKSFKSKNHGKTRVIGKGGRVSDVEDVDFVEVED